MLSINELQDGNAIFVDSQLLDHVEFTIIILVIARIHHAKIFIWSQSPLRDDITVLTNQCHPVILSIFLIIEFKLSHIFLTICEFLDHRHDISAEVNDNVDLVHHCPSTIGLRRHTCSWLQFDRSLKDLWPCNHAVKDHDRS